MIVGKKGIYGSEIITIESIIINNFVMVKFQHGNKIAKIHINNIEFI